VPDLFFPDAYFAVAAGLLVAAASRGISRVAPAQLPLVLPIAACAVLAWQVRTDNAERRGDSYDLRAQRSLASIVRLYHQQYSDVWVYGAVHLLGLAHLDNHVPYGLFYDDVLSVLSIDTWLPLRDGRMPEIIVYSRGQLPG